MDVLGGRLLALALVASVSSAQPGFASDLAEALEFTASVMGPEMHMTRGFEAMLGQFDPNEGLGFLLSKRVIPGAATSEYPLDPSREAPAIPDDDPREPNPDERVKASVLLAVLAAAGAASGLPPALLDAIIQVESGYRIRAESASGARGLMQLMPRTAAELGVTDSFEPRQNVMAGALYLRRLYDRLGSLPRALAAYHDGLGSLLEAGGNPSPRAQRYVDAVLRRYEASSLR